MKFSFVSIGSKEKYIFLRHAREELGWILFTWMNVRKYVKNLLITKSKVKNADLPDLLGNCIENIFVITRMEFLFDGINLNRYSSTLGCL